MNHAELFPAMSISATGLRAERVRMEVASHNLANANTTRGPDGEVFRRKQVVFSTALDRALKTNRNEKMAGVHVDQITEDTRPPIEVHAPYHPDADDRGMLKKPDISPIKEMLDMITATRAYEANLAALRQSRDIARQTITLGRAR